MGCKSSKAQLATVSGPTHSQPRLHQHTTRGVHTLEEVAPPNGDTLSIAEKRARAAKAAEARKGDWRHGGHLDPQKARSLAQRREVDDLLAKIDNRYTMLGRDPPIGLPSCDLNQLRRHLETLL